MPIPLLPEQPVGFPPVDQALDDPDGLLAAGGQLTPEWLLEAYAHGIFPWFNSDDEYILWWSPGQRAILRPGTMKVSKSLRKRLRNGPFTATLDTAFDAVVRQCQAPRDYSAETWITAHMREAYTTLHQLGFAHSIEIWQDEQLVGGLYGVSLGTCFFGESMFSRATDASKVAFFCLSELLRDWSFTCIDCQLSNPHLLSLGVQLLPRRDFVAELAQNPLQRTRQGRWQLPDGSANLLTYARRISEST